ncbi:EF-hand domain-containing protein [Micavibrio aeruginosavorus]|uniref:EF-hand domain-containing protein n=1 Tax=Micavibrio aeruginosavorus EPB TaxID=349215 RepID=M4VVC3_9BACT|nr:hypothetical protein [Micavibrio aeruginosavorus]AGH97149.1 hypothetical protein A11S_314 [Micavibrio aeruginosavorus EPB]
MKNLMRRILLTGSVLVPGFLALGAIPAGAETVMRDTYVKQIDMPNTTVVNFGAFDTNKDGILSRDEVGERLFISFDNDGNGVIDNVEFDQRNVLTYIPMERGTILYFDYNDDGIIDDMEKLSQQSFIEKSMLDRFAKDPRGLSPRDFIEMGFWQLDTDRSRVIELSEWKRGYEVALRPEVAESYLYNQ